MGQPTVGQPAQYFPPPRPDWLPPDAAWEAGPVAAVVTAVKPGRGGWWVALCTFPAGRSAPEFVQAAPWGDPLPDSPLSGYARHV